MTQKLQLAVLCGGQSAEHEVSVISAKNVIRALDKNKYHINVIFIHKTGEWFLFSSSEVFLNLKAQDIPIHPEDLRCQRVSLTLGNDDKGFVTLNGAVTIHPVDVIFPVLHGSHGEDGTVQGLLELANIPYVGPGVLSSSICMDKEISKRLLAAAKIPIAKFITANYLEARKLKFKDIEKKLGLPFFVKPANTGSSVGITKVKNKHQFQPAIEDALQYDSKILIEQYIPGREIECAILGNEMPEASLPGEIKIISHHEFYTYEAKYIDPNGADLIIPAKFPKSVIKQIQATAIKAFTTLNCEGMARIDFFVTKNHKIYVNEANTIPGFTQISMYPKMWQASGVSYSDLLDKLIALALKRFERDRVLVAARSRSIEMEATAGSSY